MVDINQADPQSNAIHVAHNIPKDSDITVVQTNPFNTTVHISMNVGTGSKVQVCSLCFHLVAIITLTSSKYAGIIAINPGEGDDDKFTEPAAARQLQWNGKQVLHIYKYF